MARSGERVVVGYALRALVRRGRRYDDMVLLQADPEDRADVVSSSSREIRVLSVSPIVVDSETGPVLLIDRVLPRRFDDPTGWIDHAVSKLIPGTRTEDTIRAPMPDAEFWTYVDLLHGEVTDDGLARLTDALSALPHLQVVAFRDALWRKLRSLDHPQTTIRSDDGIVSADASLYYRCELVAAGESAYDAAIKSPRPGSDEDGSVGEGLLNVAEDAALEELPQAEIEIETGRNGMFWPDAAPSAFPWMDLPSVGAFSPHIQSEVLDELALSLGFTSFVAFAVSGDGHVRELMGCLMAGSFANAREELLPFLRAHLAPNERLDDRLIVWQSGALRAMVLSSLTGLSRRSSLSMDEYIDLYYNGEL